MRVFKLVFVFFICCVFIPLSGYSSDVLVPLVGSERAEELRNKGCVMDHNNKKDYPVLIPESQFVKEKIALLIRELDPNLFVESLNLYEKPSDISSLWIRDQLNLFNSVLTLSTLKGLRYFSKTKGKMRILYEESFVVDSTDTSYRLPDPVFTALPDSLILYAKQKDSTFGENTYLYTYYCIPEGLIF
ncbi:hypothetical protein LJB92_03625, partial [Bacteroidales bacterium OttesenSCG-928-M06]|nr:hypothetical protein [Bacteroidales bacterium OttesenSCG-928-M06]